jgi:spermidine synthase
LSATVRPDEPRIVDSGPLRCLQFGPDNVQSVMRHDDPNALCLAYTCKMMAFLLFNALPRRLLLLGLGGGSLARFCHHHLPTTELTVVEIDPRVVALREHFRIPQDHRMRLITADGASYIAGPIGRFDAILVDACDSQGIDPSLARPDFYANLRRRLTLNGVLSINICGTAETIASHCGRLRGVFGEHWLSLPARDDGNLVVMASRRALPLPAGMTLDRHARRLAARFGLDFARFARGLAAQRSAGRPPSAAAPSGRTGH